MVNFSKPHNDIFTLLVATPVLFLNTTFLYYNCAVHVILRFHHSEIISKCLDCHSVCGSVLVVRGKNKSAYYLADSEFIHCRSMNHPWIPNDNCVLLQCTGGVGRNFVSRNQRPHQLHRKCAVIVTKNPLCIAGFSVGLPLKPFCTSG